jgi:WD40 repeat protein
MNCQEYNRIYQEFKELQKQFEDKMDSYRETGHKDSSWNELIKKIKKKKQEMIPLLKKYTFDIFLRGEISKENVLGEYETEDRVNSVNFSPDNAKIVVGGGDNQVTVLGSKELEDILVDE